MAMSSTASRTPCAFFAQGKCRNGAACGFYHAPREDMAKLPTPCRFFLQNACTAGRNCKFSHIVDADMVTVSASTGDKAIAPGAFGVLCKFFKSGACSSGDKCAYVHPAAKSASTSASSRTEAVKKPSAVKMHVLNPKPKASEASADGDEREEKPPAWSTGPAGGDDEATTEQHMSDFISKEEELFYYGAPGEFAESDMTVTQVQRSGPTYGEVARKNAPVVMDDHFIEDFDEPAARPKMCTFFLQGLCRYGDSCFYMHSLPEEVKTEDDMIEMGRELQESAALECNICYDNVLEKGERFGLLSGCNHAFCLSCVRNWRENADQPRQTVRQCPVCRVETYFIIPSSRMVTNPARKQALISTYCKNLAAIPCRHFNEGRGTCPFGTSCFYEHRHVDGTLDARQVRTAVDSDGHYDVLREMRLEHFFQNST